MNYSAFFSFLLAVSFSLPLSAQSAVMAELDPAMASVNHPAATTTAIMVPNSLADRPATFPDGQAGLKNWLALAVDYPELAQENGREGRVILRFVVSPDGSVEQVSVVQSLGLGCDEAALQAVDEMPSWTPALQDGKTASAICYLPIDFRLR